MLLNRGLPAATRPQSEGTSGPSADKNWLRESGLGYQAWAARTGRLLPRIIAH